ncbi:MAG: hypothetical protein Q8P18_21415 [Pseudomonadota bacterium]|nr:hypothetical protein [Pseudomonadota bacterium]
MRNTDMEIATVQGLWPALQTWIAVLEDLGRPSLTLVDRYGAASFQGAITSEQERLMLAVLALAVMLADNAGGGSRFLHLEEARALRDERLTGPLQGTVGIVSAGR